MNFFRPLCLSVKRVVVNIPGIIFQIKAKVNNITAKSREVQVFIETFKAIIAKSLVPNPSFELVDPQYPNKPVSWGPIIRAEPGETSKPVLTYEGKGFLDDRCVSIYTPTNTDWGEWESEPIKLKPNTLYEITFWGKTNGEGQVVIIFDGVIRRIGGFPRDWGRVSELFITEPDAIQSTIRLLLYHRANQTVWFDHISLYPAEIELEEPKDNSTVTKNSPLLINC